MTCVNSKRVVLAICAPVLSPSVLAQAAAGAPAPPATDTAATSASALFVQRDQLQTAIAKRDAKRVTAFIRSGMDLNFNFNELAPRQRTGESPLTMAINRERLEIARLLLDAKADPNRNDDFGRRPIHCARSAEAVRLLVQFGADPNARIEFDDTITKPLAETALADRAGTPHPGPLPQAERGRSPDRNDALPPTEIAGNRQGELTGMRVGPLTWAVLYGRGDVALQLLERDRKITAAHRHLLYFAAFAGYWDLLISALPHTKEVDAANRADVTPLMLAADAGHVEAVRALLAAGAKVNARSARRWPPLLEHNPLDDFPAALAGHSPAKPRLVGGYTALRAANEKGHTEVVHLLVAAGGKE